MITLQKFFRLPAGTQKRKLMRLIGDFEQALASGEQGAAEEFRRFFQGLHVALSRGEADISLVDPGELAKMIRASQSIHATFAANRLKHILMDELGKISADWDRGGAAGSPGEMKDPERVRLSLGEPARLPVMKSKQKGLYLDDLRSPFNVGSVFRSAGFFGIDYIILSPDTPTPGNTRLDRTSMGTSAEIPWGVAGRQEFIDSLKGQGIWWCALETGGGNILEANLPPGGWMVLGNEELGVHPDILAAAGDPGRGAPGIFSIPGSGTKASLNVSVACGIALSRWASAG
jgi:TrmH family RNA methyltransferase